MPNPLKATLSLDTNDFTGGINKATNATKQFDSYLLKHKNTIDTVAHSLQGLSIGFNFAKGVVKQISPITKSIDELKNATGRLRLVTANFEELKNVQKQLFDISNNARVSYTQSVDLYARLGRSLSELNIPQKQMLQATEAINKSLIISGASSASAEAAIIQLGQGLSANALRGEELNSVMEQTPRLAQAIAKSLNVNLSGLKKLASEGALTSKVVVEAILKQKDTLQSEFTQMPLTISQSMQVLQNTIQKSLGDIDNQLQATSFISNFTKDFANSIAKLTPHVSEIANALKHVSIAVVSLVGFYKISDIALKTYNATKLNAINLLKTYGTVNQSLKNSLIALNMRFKLGNGSLNAMMICFVN